MSVLRDQSYHQFQESPATRTAKLARIVSELRTRNNTTPVMNDPRHNAFPIMDSATPKLLATPPERESVLFNASKLPFHGSIEYITLYQTLGGYHSIQGEHPWPASNKWEFLEAKAKDLKVTHPGGHHLSAKEIAQYRRNGVADDRVRAVLYGDLDCPSKDCRGRCKIEDESSQIHHTQTQNMTESQDLAQNSPCVQQTPTTMVEQAAQNRRTSRYPPSTTAASSDTQPPPSTKPETAKIDHGAISRAKKKNIQDEMAQNIGKRARRKRTKSDGDSPESARG